MDPRDEKLETQPILVECEGEHPNTPAPIVEPVEVIFTAETTPEERARALSLVIYSVTISAGLLLLIILPFVASMHHVPYSSDAELVGAVTGALAIAVKALFRPGSERKEKDGTD